MNECNWTMNDDDSVLYVKDKGWQHLHEE